VTGHVDNLYSKPSTEKNSYAEPEPQGAASFGRSRSRNAMQLRLLLVRGVTGHVDNLHRKPSTEKISFKRLFLFQITK
jgi:hypothetical protein